MTQVPPWSRPRGAEPAIQSEPVELTETDIGNGWDERSLSSYVLEQRQAQNSKIMAGMDGRRRVLPKMQTKRGSSFSFGPRGRMAW